MFKLLIIIPAGGAAAGLVAPHSEILGLLAGLLQQHVLGLDCVLRLRIERHGPLVAARAAM